MDTVYSIKQKPKLSDRYYAVSASHPEQLILYVNKFLSMGVWKPLGGMETITNGKSAVFYQTLVRK